MDASPASAQSRNSSIPQKRPRPVLSCLQCRRKKLKCDRLLPCQQCQKSRLSCTYNDGLQAGLTLASDNGERHSDAPVRKRLHDGDGEASSSALSSKATEPMTPGIIEDLQARLLVLEQAVLSKQPGDEAGTLSCKNGNGFDSAEADTVTRPVSQQAAAGLYARGRGFNLLSRFNAARTFMEKLQKPDDDLALRDLGADLRALQNALKTQKQPVQLRVRDERHWSMQEMLPSKSICDELVRMYFENHEHCLRILHKPTFLAEYEQYWRTRPPNGNTTTLDTDGGPFLASLLEQDDPTSSRSFVNTVDVGNFVPRLLAVLSIASSTNLDVACRHADLTGGWGQPLPFELIESWLRTLRPKQSSSFATLQVRALLLLPQQGRKFRPEELWTETGSVIRYAITAGLHFDPAPHVPVLEAEQRRRLWTTLLEINLMASIMSNLPTMISTEDFTCQTPLNINDDELKESSSNSHHSQHDDVWTDNICQSFLARSLRARLGAYRLLTNRSTSFTYEALLSDARKIENLLKDLPSPLKFASLSNEENIPGRLYARISLDFYLRRLLLCLYNPFAISRPSRDQYGEARIAYVQSCLVLLCYQDLFDPKFSELDVAYQGPYWDMFYRDFKHDVLQTALGVCIEIQRLEHAQSSPNEQDSVSDVGGDTTICHEECSPKHKIPVWTRTTMMKTLEDTIEPLIRRIGRNGSDLKDLMCIAIVYHSVRNTKSAGDRQKAIKDGVRNVILESQKQLHQDGVIESQLPSTSKTAERSFVATVDDDQSWSSTFDFEFDDVFGFDFDFGNTELVDDYE